MNPAPIQLRQARCLHLAAQGLLAPPRRPARLDDVVAAVTRMRLLQIDTIHVVARSPYLVLHARLGGYDPAWLDLALAQGRLAECWAHEASLVPAMDLPLHRAWRGREGHWAHKRARQLLTDEAPAMHALLERIAAQGAVRATDFPRDAPSPAAGWWSWKPEKRWLEAWFTQGALMVDRRERFQRIYDIAERVLARLTPPFVDSALDQAQLRRRFILDTVRALGIARARWIADYYRLPSAVTDAELAPLVADGSLLQVAVAGWSVPAYVHAEHADLLDRARAGRLRATHTTLLSPFDPVVWDRERALDLFGFQYTLECYTPAPRRRYGYFVLPILHRGRLVGRLDAKAHRARGVFEIIALELEPGVVATQRLLTDLARTLHATARWHATPRLQLRRCRPASFGKALRPLLRAAPSDY